MANLLEVRPSDRSPTQGLLEIKLQQNETAETIEIENSGYYRILGWVGEGNLANVYLAQGLDQEIVVIKIFNLKNEKLNSDTGALFREELFAVNNFSQIEKQRLQEKMNRYKEEIAKTEKRLKTEGLRQEAIEKVIGDIFEPITVKQVIPQPKGSYKTKNGIPYLIQEAATGETATDYLFKRRGTLTLEETLELGNLTLETIDIVNSCGKSLPDLQLKDLIITKDTPGDLDLKIVDWNIIGDLDKNLINYHGETVTVANKCPPNHDLRSVMMYMYQVHTPNIGLPRTDKTIAELDIKQRDTPTSFVLKTLAERVHSPDITYRFESASHMQVAIQECQNMLKMAPSEIITEIEKEDDCFLKQPETINTESIFYQRLRLAVLQDVVNYKDPNLKISREIQDTINKYNFWWLDDIFLNSHSMLMKPESNNDETRQLVLENFKKFEQKWGSRESGIVVYVYQQLINSGIPNEVIAEVIWRAPKLFSQSTTEEFNQTLDILEKERDLPKYLFSSSQFGLEKMKVEVEVREAFKKLTETSKAGNYNSGMLEELKGKLLDLPYGSRVSNKIGLDKLIQDTQQKELESRINRSHFEGLKFIQELLEKAKKIDELKLFQQVFKVKDLKTLAGLIETYEKRTDTKMIPALSKAIIKAKEITSAGVINKSMINNSGEKFFLTEDDEEEDKLCLQANDSEAYNIYRNLLKQGWSKQDICNYLNAIQEVFKEPEVDTSYVAPFFKGSKWREEYAELFVPKFKQLDKDTFDIITKLCRSCRLKNVDRGKAEIAEIVENLIQGNLLETFFLIKEFETKYPSYWIEQIDMQDMFAPMKQTISDKLREIFEQTPDEGQHT